MMVKKDEGRIVFPPVRVMALQARALAVCYKTPAKANIAAIKVSNIRARPEKERQLLTLHYRETGIEIIDLESNGYFLNEEAD